MKTKYRVIASAPTVHQYDSVRFFGPPEKTAGGGYVFSRDFETMQEAKDYLAIKINNYFDNGGTDKERYNMVRDLEQSKMVEYDSARAFIREVEIEQYAIRLNENWIYCPLRCDFIQHNEDKGTDDSFTFESEAEARETLREILSEEEDLPEDERRKPYLIEF